MGRPPRAALAIAGLTVALCQVGCDAARLGGRRRDPDALVVAQAADVQVLDPVLAQDSESVGVGALLFEGLLRWKAGTTELEPGLAQGWEASADARVWTFHLRPGVVFHDDTALDAAAVAFSFERLLNPSHPHYLAGQDAEFWRRQLKEVMSVVPVDPRTVQIRVARPYAPLLGNLAMFPIVSPTAVQATRDRFKEHPVGTGPFRFEAWRPGDSLVVRRFDRYWGERSRLAQIVFRVVIDGRQRLVDLESGSVDLVTALMPDEQSFVELHPDLELHRAPGNNVSYLAFNTAQRPFTDPRVRRAFAHAINKRPLVRLAFQGRAVVADGPVPPIQWGHHRPKVRYELDLPRAKALLEAATADGVFDPSATYTLFAPTTPRPYMQSPELVGRLLQNSLAQIGVKTDLRLQPYAEHNAAVAAGQHQLALFGWIGDTGDPDNFLYVLFHSDNAAPGEKVSNIAFFRDPEVDELLTAAQRAPDQASRQRLYIDAQDRIAEAAPWVPIAHSEYVIAARKDLSGVALSPRGHPIYVRIARRGPE